MARTTRFRKRRTFGYIDEPAIARWAFGSPTAAPIWLVLRLWLGYEWVHAGWEKLYGSGHAAWSNGDAIHGFVRGAVAASKAPDHPQVAYAWWVSFLQRIDHRAMFVGRAVSWTELVVGVLLILGLFTGIAAFVGLLLNFTYVLSGSAGVNPAFMVVGMLLVLAWRNAGWIGLDRWVLPTLGTPWHRGWGVRRRTDPEVVEGGVTREPVVDVRDRDRGRDREAADVRAADERTAEERAADERAAEAERASVTSES